tara:strand:+ start:2783 stop:3013 length:231 start_codon:yes stop_codon:yes gene_type:complete
MSKIITLSLSEEDEEFLLNNSELSPTKMLRAKINEVRENRSELKADLIRSENNIKRLNHIIREQGDKIHVLENKKQ